MKKDRDKIWKKFDKRCAYCGCKLKTSTGKHMHIDHVDPVRRNWWTNNEMMFPEKDTEDNLFPSCPQCNNYKHSMSLETFRGEVGKATERLEKSASYRNAKRFGMIEIKGWDGVFWFEKLNKIRG
jgi:5-methylcytosine-specific restriction endonuclease McrA